MKKRLNAEIEEDIYNKLKGKLASSGVTISDWIRQRVNEELNK